MGYGVCYSEQNKMNNHEFPPDLYKTKTWILKEKEDTIKVTLKK